MNEKSYIVAAFTVTDADCKLLPPSPEHMSEYVPELSGDSVAVPESSFGPDHAPDAVQPVASLEDHANVMDSPIVTVVGFADSEIVGTAVAAAGGASLTTMATSSPLVNSVSLAVRPSVYVPAVGNHTDAIALVVLPKDTGAGPLTIRQPTVRALPTGNLSSLTVPTTEVLTFPVADRVRA